MEKIYLDNAATTNISTEVLCAMESVLENNYGNASSVHYLGRESAQLVDESRDTLAKAINCKSNEIYFTSCGSEGNSWAIIGIAYANRNKGNHIITSKIEHPSILESCKFLEQNGFEVSYLDVDKNGFINFAQLMSEIRPSTILISIMSANNELGTIQNIKAIGQTAHEKDILFHTDAVQLFGRMKLDVQDLGIDLMTMSAHKIHGPKGMGALYISNSVKIDPIVFGGNQERGKRGGTTNVAGIVGFAKAVEIAERDMKINNYKLRSLAEYFIVRLNETIENVVINANVNQKVPNIVSVSFIGVDGESVLTKLDMEGVAVSTGSACSTNSLAISHVIKAIGLPNDDAKSTVRFSFGINNTYEEIDKTIAILVRVIAELRNYSSTYGTKTRKKKGDKNV